MSTATAFQILDEYASVLHVMRDRPVKPVEDYAAEYRQRFETGKVASRATAPPAARPQPVRKVQDHRPHAQEQQHMQQPTTTATRQQPSAMHTPTRNSTQADNVIAAISEARRQRREAEADAELTFRPVTTKMAQHHQPSNKCWHERLYVDDVQKREQHAFIKQQEREAEKRREEEDELHELSLAHREATVPTEKLYNRLYTSGRSHERWIRMQHQLQNDILAGVMASTSPGRRKAKSAERSSSVRRHGSVFEDLYHAARQRQEEQQQQLQAPRCSSDVSTRHVDTPNHTSQSSLIRKNTSSPSRHVEQVHQRLYNEAFERQQQLQAVQEESRAASVEGMFHPNLEMARRESMIKPPSDEREVSYSVGGDTTPLPTSTRRRSLSPVIIAGVDVLDVKPSSDGGAADTAFGDLLRLESTDSLSAPQQHASTSGSKPGAPGGGDASVTAVVASAQPSQTQQKEKAAAPAAAFGPAVPSLSVRPDSTTGSMTPPPTESPHCKVPDTTASSGTAKKQRTAEEERAHQERKKERRENREREKIERQRSRPLDDATALQLARVKEGTPPPQSSQQQTPQSQEVSPRVNNAAAIPKLPASFRRQGADSAVVFLKPAPVKPSAAAEDPFAAVTVDDRAAVEAQHARAASIDLRQVLAGSTDLDARLARKQSRKALMESMAILESDKDD